MRVTQTTEFSFMRIVKMTFRKTHGESEDSEMDEEGDSLEAEKLQERLMELEGQLEDMEDLEPDDIFSEAYDEWEEHRDELQNMIDELQDRISDLD